LEGLVDIAKRVLRSNLGLRSGENFLVITDTEKEEIGRALFEAGLDMGAESVIMVMKPRTRNAEEPPRIVAEAWKSADVFLAPTKYSLTHTQARKAATDSGARGATMPGITVDIFSRTLSIDYRETVIPLGSRLLEALRGARRIRVTSESGTDISFSVESREFHLDSGVFDKPGSWGNLPAGEVYVAPVEGTGEGVVVIDASLSGGIGLLEEPVVVRVEKGRAVSIEGGREAGKLRRILESVGRSEAFNFPAEFGVGCNPAARVVGIVLEDEKVHGTVHLAFGDNSTFGGNVRAGIHIDGVLRNPTVEVDGRVVIEGGKWLV
jgi:leucyl aminopeptidase (aminopeptidase T)